MAMQYMTGSYFSLKMFYGMSSDIFFEYLTQYFGYNNKSDVIYSFSLLRNTKGYKQKLDFSDKGSKFRREVEV